MYTLKTKTMKKIFYTIALLFTIAISHAQIVPVEKKIDYRLAGKGTPEGIYFKDVNNLFDKFIGTWKGTMNNKKYTFIITKVKEVHNKRTTERLMMRHLITDLSGAVISDDTTASVQIIGDCFNKNPIFYDFFYTGENAKCGLSGKVRIRNINLTTLNLILTPNTEWFAYDQYCPGGKRAEQILPTEYITLTKQ